MKLRKLLLLLSFSFLLPSCEEEALVNSRDEMRLFVQEISAYAKAVNELFEVIPQNGHELIVEDGDTSKPAFKAYLAAIDGAGQEDLFFGYLVDDRETPEEDTEYLLSYLELLKENRVEVLVTDYCSAEEKMDSSYSYNADKNFISFAADQRELNNIPSYPGVYNENNQDIYSLKDARNFLYLINPESYNSKAEFIDAISATNYDVLIMDHFINDVAMEAIDLQILGRKANGGKRLLVCYMSIGEAEDYRYYWKDEWEKDPPEWLGKENRRWKGNYTTKYWNPEWKSIIFGSTNSYLDKIINTGYDGVYLDIIEGFENFE